MVQELYDTIFNFVEDGKTNKEISIELQSRPDFEGDTIESIEIFVSKVVDEINEELYADYYYQDVFDMYEYFQ